MRTRAEIEAEVRSLEHGDKVLKKATAKRDIEALSEVLGEGERIAGIIEGFYDGGWGVVVATDRRVIFVDKALLGRRVRVEDFPYDKITSIQYSTGFVHGEITIHASGNKAEIKNVPKDRCREFAEGIRTRSSEYRSESSKPTPAAAGTPDDMVTMITRLAGLRDQGILTEEEFEAKKRQLLGLS